MKLKLLDIEEYDIAPHPLPPAVGVALALCGGSCDVVTGEPCNQMMPRSQVHLFSPFINGIFNPHPSSTTCRRAVCSSTFSDLPSHPSTYDRGLRSIPSTLSAEWQ